MVPWRYLSHIEKLGYDLNDLILHNVNRTFFFGGHKYKAECSWAIRLPVFVDGKFGYIQGFFLRRDATSCWASNCRSLALDFQPKMLRFADGEWSPATLGRQGECLLPHTESFNTRNKDLGLQKAHCRKSSE